MPRRLPLRFAAAALLAGVITLALFNAEPRPAGASHACGNTGSPFGPFDMQTYEAADYKNTYARAMELAGFNQLFPEMPTFTLPSLETGDRSAGSGQLVAPYIPPVILKSIAWLESGWAQASYDVPYGQAGPTLVSHDCGYGIMQVTTGMQNISGIPNLDQAMIGGHYAFNIARGARILADKWNQAPEYRPIVGNRDPRIIENWYYAIWAYNGFASSNHPITKPPRDPYRCDGAQPRGNYPYQELVLGCVANPPSRSGVQLWPPQEVHLPNLADPAFVGLADGANFNTCSSTLQCAGMDIPTPNPAHADPTVPGPNREALFGAPSLALSHNSINVASIPGGQSLPTTVAVANLGNNVLAWRATTSASWLKISSHQDVSLGTDLGSVLSTLKVHADASGLPPGLHIATVAFESRWSGSTPAFISVTLLVDLQAGLTGAGDFSGDGRTDIVFLCCSDYAAIWTARPAGDFSVSTFRPWPNYGMTMGTWQLGHFNNDNKVDLIHLCCEDYANVWLSNGDGSFSIHSFSPSPGYAIQYGSWMTGDFNADGLSDLAHLCCPEYGNIWLADGSGGFSVVPFQPWPGYNMRLGKWQAGDFDGDSKTDLVHLCCENYVHVWSSLGNGAFTVSNFRPWLDYGVQFGSWQTGDFNGDRLVDLIHLCCEHYANIWWSQGAGVFAISGFQPWPDYGIQLGAWRPGDLNADGKTDLVHLCCGDYANTFVAQPDGSLAATRYSPWPGYGLGLGLWQQGDFDGGGRFDLLHLCCHYANVWRSTGDGRFEVRVFAP